MTYCPLALLRASLRLTDQVDDDLLKAALLAADEAVNVYCGRTFTPATADETRYFAAAKPDYVEIDDCTSLTEVAYARDGATWEATTNYQAEPLNRRTDGIAYPYTRLRAINQAAWPTMQGLQTVRVTGRFEFGYLPASVTEAAKLLASRWFTRNASPLGVAGWGDLGVMRVSSSDVDVERMLLPYMKYRAAL